MDGILLLYRWKCIKRITSTSNPKNQLYNPLIFPQIEQYLPSMTTHIVTQIKRQVDDARMRQYSANKDKKQLKYFSLYLKEIILIQRAWRKYTVWKGLMLEQEISRELQRKQLLHFQQKRLTKQLQQQQAKRQLLLHPTTLPTQLTQHLHSITSTIRSTLSTITSCADKYARNSAVTKISLTELQKLKKEELELEAQVRELELEKQCYEQRVAMWKGKLVELRGRIVEERGCKREVERELGVVGE